MRGRVLVVDDDDVLLLPLVSALGRAGFAVTPAIRASEALALIEAPNFEMDIVVTDLSMPEVDGIALVQRVAERHPDVPVIVMTAHGGMDAAVSAMRAGAWDFIAKPFELSHLTVALDRALQQRWLRHEVRRLRAVTTRPAVAGLVGSSPALGRVVDLIRRAADVNVNVLITGESGTGKEVVARALHAQSSRAQGPFVAVNCAALPENLLESELYGHKRGAFTDARTDRVGLFQQANGGTLFLDEVGELPIALQPKLLRALQERKARPIGGDQEIAFDVRFLFATNKDLEAEIEARRFREDIYYRINVVHIDLPPLRERGGDVLVLAQSFLEEFARRLGKRVIGLAPETSQLLAAYDWPGNVRELLNVIERAVALTTTQHITPDDLPDRLRAGRRHVEASAPVVEAGEPLSLEEVERRHILFVLDYAQRNRARAARILGLDRKTLYRKLEKWGETGDS